MNKKLTKPSVYIPLAALCCILWSSAFPFIKLGYRYFAIAADDYASQILFAGCRFMLAGVITLILASLIAKKPLIPQHRDTVHRIMILSLAQTAVQYTLFYFALAKIEVERAENTRLFTGIRRHCTVELFRFTPGRQFRGRRVDVTLRCQLCNQFRINQKIQRT